MPLEVDELLAKYRSKQLKKKKAKKRAKTTSSSNTDDEEGEGEGGGEGEDSIALKYPCEDLLLLKFDKVHPSDTEEFDNYFRCLQMIGFENPNSVDGWNGNTGNPLTKHTFLKLLDLYAAPSEVKLIFSLPFLAFVHVGTPFFEGGGWRACRGREGVRSIEESQAFCVRK